MQCRSHMNLRFLLIFACTLFTACEKTMKDALPPTTAQLLEFSRVTGITFPTRVTPQLFWEDRRGMDDSVFLKVTLPVDACPAFIATPPFVGTTIAPLDNLPGTTRSDAVIRGMQFKIISGYFRDWMPHSPEKFRYCEPDLPNGQAMKCLFDFDDPKTVIAYLMWFET